MRAAALSLLFNSLFTATLFAGGIAQAAPLSVCSEASPEGFDVVQYNSLTTTNATADVLMNRLVEFDAAQGSGAEPGGQLDGLGRRAGVRLHPARRCEVPYHPVLQAHPRIECR